MENLQGFETWFFGGFISLALVVIGFMVKAAYTEMKEMLKANSADIAELKSVSREHNIRIESVEESTIRGNESFEAIMTKLGAMGSRMK